MSMSTPTQIRGIKSILIATGLDINCSKYKFANEELIKLFEKYKSDYKRLIIANSRKEFIEIEAENKKLREVLTAFVELEDSGLSEPSRIKYQTQRARDLLKLY